MRKRTALAARRDAFHDRRQSRRGQVVDEVPTEDDVDAFGSAARQQRLHGLPEHAWIGLVTQRGEAVGEIRRILAGTPLPPGYVTSLEGTFHAQEEAARMIGALALVSLALIFLILFQRYRSVLLALIVPKSLKAMVMGR